MKIFVNVKQIGKRKNKIDKKKYENNDCKGAFDRICYDKCK